MRVTVCGAGPAGLGIAACLLSRGHSVFLYDMPEYGDRIRPFQQDPSIRCTGKLVHSGRLAGASTDPAEALREADAIFLVTHAAAHQRLARLFAGHLREGQVVVMCPGYVGGGLAFTAALQEAGSGVLPPFAEASSLPIISQMAGPGEVSITGWKRNFLLYRPLELDEHPAVQWFYDLYSPLQTSRHPLEPGLNEINFIVHAVVSLLNASTVEHGQPWTFYRSGLCPAIMKVIEAIDQERTQLEEALGLVPHRLTDLLFAFYKDQGMSHGSLYEQLSTFEPFAKVPGPLDFSSRFISEDLCYGLVPMAWLGQLSGLPMEYTNLVIRLATAYTGMDYKETGRRFLQIPS